MDLSINGIENSERVHILVVDDDPIILEKAAVLLERKGYLVTCSTTGIEANMLLKVYPGVYDVVVADYSISNLNGILSTEISPSENNPFVLHMDIDDLMDKKTIDSFDMNGIAGELYKINELDLIINTVVKHKKETVL